MFKHMDCAIKDEFYGDVLLDVKYGLEDGFSNQKPYFSITCVGRVMTKERQLDKRYKRSLFFGACHDKILQGKPELKDLVDFHLRDIDGEPLCAVENGYHFLENKQVNTLSKYFGISKEESQNLIDKKLDKEEFSKIVDGYRVKWKQEADALIKKYGLEAREYKVDMERKSVSPLRPKKKEQTDENTLGR